MYVYAPAKTTTFPSIATYTHIYIGDDHSWLQLRKGAINTLTAYSDADWGGCTDTRRSTSGYCIYLGPNIVSWSAKREPTVSRSSSGAEYKGVANTVAKLSWICNLLVELHWKINKASVVYCDNISSVYMATNPVKHQRTKHIQLDQHFVEEKNSHWWGEIHTCSLFSIICRHIYERSSYITLQWISN